MHSASYFHLSSHSYDSAMLEYERWAVSYFSPGLWLLSQPQRSTPLAGTKLYCLVYTQVTVTITDTQVLYSWKLTSTDMQTG